MEKESGMEEHGVTLALQEFPQLALGKHSRKIPGQPLVRLGRLWAL